MSIVGVGNIPVDLIKRVAAAVSEELRAGVALLPERLDPEFARDALRDQYNSTRIVVRLSEMVAEEGMRILGVAEVDLFIPILTFVFGEAQLGCCAAVMSSFRLRQEYYGLPPDGDLLVERSVKEALHELGHTFGLRHCPDYSCVMHSSNTVDDVDIKWSAFCSVCKVTIG